MKGDKRMAKYIAKRVALAIVTLLVLTSVVFVLVRLMPGDPFSSDKMTPEIKANLEAYYGLDKPLAEQYITYMKNVLHGDLGYSMKYESQTVNRIIADSFPYSADLGIRSLCFALFFGLPVPLFLRSFFYSIPASCRICSYSSPHPSRFAKIICDIRFLTSLVSSASR